MNALTFIFALTSSQTHPKDISSVPNTLHKTKHKATFFSPKLCPQYVERESAFES